MVTGAPPRSLSAPVTVRNLVSVADITFYYCTALWVVYDAKRDGMHHFISLSAATVHYEGGDIVNLFTGLRLRAAKVHVHGLS